MNRGWWFDEHRDDKAWIINPGKWATFGGHLEPYETPEDGWLREMEEELSWRPTRCDMVWAFDCDCDGPVHLVYDFAAPLDVPADALEQHEGQGMGWFAPHALPGGIVPKTRDEITRFVASPRYQSLAAEAQR